MPVPQVVHLPFIASRLFFIVTFWVSFISFLDLHFTQYPTSAIYITSFNFSIEKLSREREEYERSRDLFPVKQNLFGSLPESHPIVKDIA